VHFLCVCRLVEIIMWRCLVVFLFGCICTGLSSPIRDNSYVKIAADYKYYCVGNCKNDVNTTTSYGVVLMGGGPDVDAAFVWMINKAGPGDFLVLRADDDNAYNSYIYGLGKLNSVATLVILNKYGAADPFVVQTLKNAEALFLAGGNQWTYYSEWNNSPVSNAFVYLSKTKQIPIGGTSAGGMSQGQFMYTAQYNSIESSDAMRNPYSKDITLGKNFMQNQFLQNVLVDAHFYERDRMGRLLTFVARLLKDSNSSQVMGVGVDEGTAILIDANGVASITSWYSDGSAYFVSSDQIPQRCQRNERLTFKNIETYRATGNTTALFDFKTWTGDKNKGTAYTLSVTDAYITSTQSNGRIY